MGLESKTKRSNCLGHSSSGRRPIGIFLSSKPLSHHFLLLWNKITSSLENNIWHKKSQRVNVKFWVFFLFFKAWNSNLLLDRGSWNVDTDQQVWDAHHWATCVLVGFEEGKDFILKCHEKTQKHIWNAISKFGYPSGSVQPLGPDCGFESQLYSSFSCGTLASFLL